MTGPIDYGKLVQALGLLDPVAMKNNPLSKNVNPMVGTEGARVPSGGGGRTITTDTGKRIRLTEEPKWNDFHQKWYAYGNQMIKTRGTWSGTTGLHHFKSFTPDDE
jgi:hypothetical protein